MKGDFKMIIRRMKIGNYRNLDGVTINFHKDINFLVGENNIGKTNILELLHTIFNRRGFNEKDFSNPDKPIEIELEILLNEGEEGVFDDYFTADKSIKSIEIIVKQETIDDNIIYIEKNTGDQLFRNQVVNANFISYGSVRRPDKELSFDDRENNFLNKIIKVHIEERKETTYLNTDAVDEMVTFINNLINKIKTFNLFDIRASYDQDISNLLGRIIQLQSEEKFEIKDLGEGIQFINSIPLVLLNQIARIIKADGENRILDIEGKKVLYLIVSIDEPELHLHPHSQRFFIHYLRDILSGKNEKFNELLKEIFNLDYLKGQLITITHSPFILLNDYRYISRLYKENKKLKFISGTKLNIPNDKIKDLHRFFGYLKEAFFARKVLVVEGDTELGAVTSLFDRIGTHIHSKGISVVNARSVDSVPNVMELFSKFGIEAYGYIDKDDGNLEKEKFKGFKIYQTEEEEFEDEIAECLSLDGLLNFLKDRGVSIRNFTAKVVKNYVEKITLDDPDKYVEEIQSLDEHIKDEIFQKLKTNIINHLKTNKGFLTGSIIMDHIVDTPMSLKKVLDKLVNNE